MRSKYVFSLCWHSVVHVKSNSCPSAECHAVTIAKSATCILSLTETKNALLYSTCSHTGTESHYFASSSATPVKSAISTWLPSVLDTSLSPFKQCGEYVMSSSASSWPYSNSYPAVLLRPLHSYITYIIPLSARLSRPENPAGGAHAARCGRMIAFFVQFRLNGIGALHYSSPGLLQLVAWFCVSYPTFYG